MKKPGIVGHFPRRFKAVPDKPGADLPHRRIHKKPRHVREPDVRLKGKGRGAAATTPPRSQPAPAAGPGPSPGRGERTPPRWSLTRACPLPQREQYGPGRGDLVAHLPNPNRHRGPSVPRGIRSTPSPCPGSCRWLTPYRAPGTSTSVGTSCTPFPPDGRASPPRSAARRSIPAYAQGGTRRTRVARARDTSGINAESGGIRKAAVRAEKRTLRYHSAVFTSAAPCFQQTCFER